MRLDPNRLAVAGLSMAALSWSICALLVAAAPDFMLRVTEGMLHADLAGMTWHLTWGSFFIGLVAWSVLAGVAGALVAWTYNHVGVPLPEPGTVAHPQEV